MTLPETMLESVSLAFLDYPLEVVEMEPVDESLDVW